MGFLAVSMCDDAITAAVVKDQHYEIMPYIEKLGRPATVADLERNLPAILEKAADELGQRVKKLAIITPAGVSYAECLPLVKIAKENDISLCRQYHVTDAMALYATRESKEKEEIRHPSAHLLFCYGESDHISLALYYWSYENRPVHPYSSVNLGGYLETLWHQKFGKEEPFSADSLKGLQKELNKSDSPLCYIFTSGCSPLQRDIAAEIQACLGTTAAVIHLPPYAPLYGALSYVKGMFVPPYGDILFLDCTFHSITLDAHVAPIELMGKDVTIPCETPKSICLIANRKVALIVRQNGTILMSAYYTAPETAKYAFILEIEEDHSCSCKIERDGKVLFTMKQGTNECEESFPALPVDYFYVEHLSAETLAPLMEQGNHPHD